MIRKWIRGAACLCTLGMILLAAGQAPAEKPATGTRQGTATGGTTDDTTGATTTPGATGTVPTMQELIDSFIELLKLILQWFFGLPANPDPAVPPATGSPAG